jgi:uncharacterized Fe-S cluster-containing MiaB family protein
MNKQRLTKKEPIDTKKSFGYPIREDRNGKRPVILLGNEREDGCPYQCSFCNVKNLTYATSKQNISDFNKQYHELRRKLAGGRYHALIYNSGNATNPEEMSSEVLDHILRTFNKERRFWITLLDWNWTFQCISYSGMRATQKTCQEYLEKTPKEILEDSLRS